MKVTITEVFCEVISGVAIIFLLVAVLLLFGTIEYEALVNFGGRYFSLGNLTIAMAISYMLGIIFDAIGMHFDYYFEDLITCEKVSPEQRTQFYKNISEHVMAYWSETWAYYFCFRNLFMLIPINAVLWCVVLWDKLSTWAVSLIVATVLVLMISIWKTMQVLLSLYYKIFRSISL